MRTVDEHLARVLTGVAALEPLDVSLLEARGCLLAEPVTAPWPLPPFDAAAADGYAVRAGDCAGGSPKPVVLSVIDDVPAGYRASHPVGPGQAIRIMAGAPMPPGADAVVSFGRTDSGMPTVRVHGPVLPGHNVARAGAELAVHQVVLEAGARIGAREVALLAAVGRSRVSVRPRPRVVVVSTGTELVEPGGRMVPGLIPDSNGCMLTAAATDAGALAFRAGPVPDEPQALTNTLEDQLAVADLIVTTGGVAVGTHATVESVLDRLGAVDFSPVAIDPGTPQGHGHLGPARVPVMSLPGNPSSAFVAFEVFVRPVIRRMLGHRRIHRTMLTARLAMPLIGHPSVRSFVRARLDTAGGERVVTPVEEPGLMGLRLADSLIVLPEGEARVPAGASVAVMAVGGP